jgi:serine/threonine-protein kinase RsbW
MTQLHNLPPLPCASRPAPFLELQQHLPSRITAISPFVDGLMQFLQKLIKKLGDVDEDEGDIQIALGEALANAVIHGNRENLHKCVYVTCRLSMDGVLLLTVRDEGGGFDSHAIADPTDRQKRLLPNGRGIYLMRALLDEVCFEENGKVVHMRKRLRRRLR